MWDDVDMDHMGLDKFGLSRTDFMIDLTEARVFKCYKEDWEDDCIATEDLANMIKLLKKYGGIKFDEGGLFTIDKDKMNFKTKGGHRGFKVLGCRPLYNKHDPDDDHFDNFIIDGDLYGLIYSYYKAHPDPKIQIETRPEDLAANGEWNNWEPNETGQPRQKKQSRAPPAPPANRNRVEPAPTELSTNCQS